MERRSIEEEINAMERVVVDCKRAFLDCRPDFGEICSRNVMW